MHGRILGERRGVSPTWFLKSIHVGLTPRRSPDRVAPTIVYRSMSWRLATSSRFVAVWYAFDVVCDCHPVAVPRRNEYVGIVCGVMFTPAKS